MRWTDLLLRAPALEDQRGEGVDREAACLGGLLESSHRLGRDSRKDLLRALNHYTMSSSEWTQLLVALLLPVVAAAQSSRQRFTTTAREGALAHAARVDDQVPAVNPRSSLPSVRE